MIASTLEIKASGFHDLTRLFDTAPARYDPQLEGLYQQRMNSKHGGESNESRFDENAVTKWMSDDEEAEVFKSKSGSRSASKSRSSSKRGDSRATKRGEEMNGENSTQQEDVLDFEDEFPLEDEASWSCVPRHHAVGRFSQYRRLCRAQFDDITGRYDLLRKNSERKVQTLKGQFQEHKARWMNERELLVRAVQSSEAHREVAQGFAEKAVTQMETMIEVAESEDSSAVIADPSGRQSVMQARINFLEITNAELEEKVGRTEEIVRTLESQLEAKGQIPGRPNASGDGSRAQSTKSKRVTITEEGSRVSSAVSSQLSDARRTASDARRSLQASRQSLVDSRAAVASTSDHRLEDMELDENADMPFPRESSAEGQAMIPSRQSSLLKKDIPLINHPIVQEYVRTYDNMMRFKEKLASMLLDKALMSHATDLNELEPISLKSESSVANQVEEMGRSIVLVLDQTLVLVKHMLTTTDGDFAVSSLNLSGGSESHAGSQLIVPGPAAEAERLREELEALKAKYNDLKAHLDDSNKKYEDKLNENTTIMMEMQGTILNLKREITNLSEAPNCLSRGVGMEEDEQRDSPVGAAPTAAAADTSGAIVAGPTRQQTLIDIRQPSVIFTRLDYERNAKSLKRALNEARLEKDAYQDALRKMEDYTRIPAARLAVLVKKYLHHKTMLTIQENAKKHTSLSAEVFQVWDTMELMEERRQIRYSQLADFLTQERFRMAQVLVDTFDDLEERCSIFLIKPVLSLQSKEDLRHYYSALVELRERERRQAKALEEEERRRQLRPGVHPTPEGTRILREAPGPLRGSGIREPKAAPPVTFWNPTTVHKGQNYLSDSLTAINTPKILEMDVNRILLGQNNVSVPLQGFLSNAAAPQLSVRTYISVARPSTQPKAAYMFDEPEPSSPRTKSGPHRIDSNKVPPSTPLERAGHSAGAGSLSRASKDLSGQPPLPPITPTPRDPAEDSEVDVMALSDAEGEEKAEEEMKDEPKTGPESLHGEGRPQGDEKGEEEDEEEEKVKEEEQVETTDCEEKGEPVTEESGVSRPMTEVREPLRTGPRPSVNTLNTEHASSVHSVSSISPASLHRSSRMTSAGSLTSED